MSSTFCQCPTREITVDLMEYIRRFQEEKQNVKIPIFFSLLALTFQSGYLDSSSTVFSTFSTFLITFS